ncbi:MAG: hypothetical protein ABEH81_04130 [Halopenitus sp.]
MPDGDARSVIDTRAGVPIDELAWLLVATTVATALILIATVIV